MTKDNYTLLIRPSVVAFARTMENKLQEYDDTRGKQGWLEEPLSYLYERLQEKYAALSNAIMADDITEILSISTGIATCIMMIHDKIREETNRRANNVENIPTD